MRVDLCFAYIHTRFFRRLHTARVCIAAGSVHIVGN